MLHKTIICIIRTTQQTTLQPTQINENPSHGFVVDFVIELDKDTAKKAVLIVMGEGNTMLTVDGVMVPHYKEQ